MKIRNLRECCSGGDDRHGHRKLFSASSEPGATRGDAGRNQQLKEANTGHSAGKISQEETTSIGDKRSSESKRRSIPKASAGEKEIERH